MKTSAAKEFDQLTLTDQAIIIESLKTLLDRLIARRLQEAVDIRLGKRLPCLN